MTTLIAMAGVWTLFLWQAPTAIENAFEHYKDFHMRALVLVSAFTVIVLLIHLSVIFLLAEVGEPPIWKIF